jgi:carboxyl-terminal processing protease
MKKNKNILLLILLAFSLLISCRDAPLPLPEPEKEQEQEKPDVDKADKLTQEINKFIKAVMEDAYLWNDKMPKINILREKDPKAYFKKLLYEEDKWSYVTDDVEALVKSFEGEETSFGYSLAFGRFSDTGKVFAIVEYVYPATPAAEAGLKRGDIIVLMNGKDITDKNYLDLLNAGSLSINLGVLGEDEILTNRTPIRMTARELVLDPVLITKVIEHEGRKIGYLFYAQYIHNFNTSLDTAFSYLKDKGITDLVVDLRYNPGGDTYAAQHLCSSVAPLSAVNDQKQLVSFQWNKDYQAYWEYKNDTEQLGIWFNNTTPVKMDFDKMYILTGPGTASASELTITGLNPYMDIRTIGESTYGKYTASVTFKPEDLSKTLYNNNPSEYKDFKNWGIQPIVLRYANSLGVTDFKDGFAPDIPVEEDIFDGIPLGDEQDPLLAAAIEDITGVPVIAMKKARIPVSYTIFDRGFSKFDANKRELPLGKPDKEKFFRKEVVN